MKLIGTHTSPYVRKVMACAVARGLDGRLDLDATNPHQSPPELLRVNPLSRVPALLLDDGTALYDSPVICEYLDTLGDAAPLFPPTGTPARLKAQVMHATADGILDAAVGRRGNMPLPQDDGRRAYDARQKAAVDRALAVLEKAPPRGLSDIGAIAVACALGYLDFRFAQEPWREAHPGLAEWFAKVSTLPPLARTAPTA